MQNLSARKFSLRTPRFDSNTGKRTFWYSWRALAAGLALALVAGSGIAVAAVGVSAGAHTPKITVTCQGIHVVASKYSSSDTNTVKVSIAGTAVDVVQNFQNSFDQTFTFPDSTKAWNFHAEITTTASDPAYKQVVNGPSTPCAAPTISGAASACNAVNGSTSLSASFGQLVVGHTYQVKLDGPTGNISTKAGYAPATATIASYSEPSWLLLTAGKTYTVTITDESNKDLTAKADIVSVGCPTQSSISITPTECTTEVGNATFTITANGLVAQRQYRVDVTKDGVVQKQAPFVATAASYTSAPIAATAGSVYSVTITDVAGTITSPPSTGHTFLPCPKTPTIPTLKVAQCTSTNGTSNAGLNFSVANLVPLRSYVISVVDGANKVVFTASFQAASSTWPTPAADQHVDLDPGTYSVSVTDSAIGSFAATKPVTIGACPTLPVLSLTPAQCTVPGGTASIGTTITTFIPGRVYTVGVTLVQGGATVVAPTSVTAPTVGAWVLPAFANLPPGAQYRITVTDSVVTSVSAYGDIALKVCPGVPTVVLQADCNVLGSSTVNVSLDKLEPTETYTVNILNAANKNVGSATVAGTTPAATLQLNNISNGASYVVTVANATNTLTGSASIFLQKCGLTTLAFTGANPVGPAVAGIGFLQLGLVFVGLGLVRRRRTA